MRTIYILFGAIATYVLFVASASGAANNFRVDATGSPLASEVNGNNFCGRCHGGNNLSSTINLEVLDGENTVTVYEAGKMYTVRVSISTMGDGAAGYGFQAVALTGTDNEQAGAFTGGNGIQVTDLGGRQYAEHTMRTDNEGVFEFQWTAPTDNLNDIRFYAAGVSANGNGTNSNDGAAKLSEAVLLTNTRRIPELAEGMRIFPNPVDAQLQLQLDIDEATAAQLRLFNSNGQLVQQQNQHLVSGRNQVELDASQLAAGMYWLEVSNGQAASRVAVLKR